MTEATPLVVQQRPLFARRKYILTAVALCVVLLIAWMIYYPVSIERQSRGLCQVVGTAHYEIVTRGGDTLTFSLSSLRLTDERGDSLVAQNDSVGGAFVSLDGEVLTTAGVIAFAPDSLSPETLNRALRVEEQRLVALRPVLLEARDELDYYARTHIVTDDGYNEVMAYREDNFRRIARVDSMLHRLREAINRGIAAVHLRADYRVRYVEEENKRSATYAAHLVRRTDSLLLLRLDAGRLPRGAYRFATYLATPSRHRATLIAFLPHTYRLVTLSADSAVAGGFMPEGAVAVNAFGQLCGISVGGHLSGGDNVGQMIYDERGWLSRTWTTVSVSVAELFSHREVVPLSTDTVRTVPNGNAFGTLYGFGGRYFGQVCATLPQGFGRMHYAGGAVYEGFWDKGKRAGYGRYTTSEGSLYTGVWRNDTLPLGERIDSLGRYVGSLAGGCPEGMGTLYFSDGSYYHGAWRAGLRDGFGLAVGEQRMVRVGSWKHGDFLGEQMIYSSERVFGIDISRYQHDIGRRHYPIDWSHLSIRHLGRAKGDRRRVRGQQNYPVDYVYIKATESVNISNRYYAADARSARRCGIPTGAYHFFSTRRDGAAQGRYFLSVARPQRGDLPPMLDIEPNDSQVKAMGGAAALWREVLAWIRVVEAHCGTSPILYVSQSFVNKYMPEAPGELSRYSVWIARYSEYKPYVHLLYWQLSPDGSVAGIHGDVDINVFNGTREQFVTYCRENGVKRSGK